MGRCCANVALHAFLARMHTLFVLLHGRVNKLLEQVGGLGARTHVVAAYDQQHKRVVSRWDDMC